MQTGVISCTPPPEAIGGSYGDCGDTQRSQSTHATSSVSPVARLRSLEDDAQRDVIAAQQRAKLMQEEVDALLARIAETQTASEAVTSENDPVMQKIEAIRKLRAE